MSYLGQMFLEQLVRVIGYGALFFLSSMLAQCCSAILQFLLCDFIMFSGRVGEALFCVTLSIEIWRRCYWRAALRMQDDHLRIKISSTLHEISPCFLGASGSMLFGSHVLLLVNFRDNRCSTLTRLHVFLLITLAFFSVMKNRNIVYTLFRCSILSRFGQRAKKALAWHTFARV